MASADLEKKAKEAYLHGHFQLAAHLFSKAIALNPNDAGLFVDRAQARIKLQNFAEAVADANKVIELDPSIAEAYLLKGEACIKLEEYQTAMTALRNGISLAPRDSRFTKLIKDCDQHLWHIAEKASSSTQPKYRHEFYQKPEEIIVTIYAKGIPAYYVAVDFDEQILSVTIEVPGEDAYHFQPQLFGKIVPSKCRYVVMPTKIEISLAKADSTRWASLEISSNGKPSYPSSKTRGVDWDALAAQVEKEEMDEKRYDGPASIFRDIYKNGEEEARRAMLKSFVESNGTVLSANWGMVGGEKVETIVPDYLDFKKW